MLTGRHLVLIEDDTLMGGSLVQRLELEGADVTWVRQAGRGVSAVRSPRHPVDAVVCDIRLPDGSGEEVFGALSRTIVPPPFLFITGQGDIDQAVRLLRAGGADYMTKPFDMPAFLDRLALILRPDPAEALPPQTGISPLARRVDALVAEVARNDRPVLIRGERGLGKARIARRLHAASDRAAAPFAELDAFRAGPGDGALAEALGSVGDGTLFVNGIGRLDGAGQDRLVEALRSAGFSFVAASGSRIDEKARAGGFRSDLLYLLMASEIAVPPLSQRAEEVAWLAGRLFQALNRRRKPPLKGISDLAMAAIRDHDWPGNGREIRSRILRAVDVAEGDWIYPVDVFPDLTGADSHLHSLSEARALAERRQIVRALDRTGGQLAEAARLLRVSRTTLWEKMHKLGL